MQALAQKAGSDGVTTILEKLFMNIKFDILGSKVTAVEVTEEAVLGKERPNYFFANGVKVGPMKSTFATSAPSKQSFHESLCTNELPAILEESESRISSSRSSSEGGGLTDFEKQIFNELEI